MEGMAELTEELTGITGVEGAELSVGDDGLTGVRVRLEADADVDGVGRAVQEVMVRHGVRARLGSAQPPVPPSPGSSVVTLADRVESVVSSVAGSADEVPEQRPAAGADRVEGVAVTETEMGLEVSVTSSDGRSVGRRCRGGDDAIAEAVTIATSELFDAVGAELIEYRRNDMAESNVVTVVIATPAGARIAGAAVVGAAFPFAVARAVWSALSA